MRIQDSRISLKSGIRPAGARFPRGLAIAMVVLVGGELFGKTYMVRASPSPAKNSITRVTSLSRSTCKAPTEVAEMETNDTPVCAEFLQWLDRFEKGDDLFKIEIEGEGYEIALRRFEVMESLIRERPFDAIAVALSPATRSRLPARIKRLVEECVSGYARIGPVFVCGQEPSQNRAIIFGSKIYIANQLPPRFERERFQNQVFVRGIAIASEMALETDPARLWNEADPPSHAEASSELSHCAGCGNLLQDGPGRTHAILGGSQLPLCQPEHLELLNAAIAGANGGFSGTAPPPPPEWTQGNKSLLYLIVQYADQSSPPTSRTTAESSLTQVNGFFQAQSLHRTTVTGTVTDPVMLSQPSAYYLSSGLGQLYNDAVAAARVAGWEADNYDFVFVRHAGGPGGIGVALVGAKGAWVQTDNWNIVAHELGHNYGLFHANGWRPTTSSPCGPGTSVEYGDVYDIMGPNTGCFNTYERSILHWLPDTACQRITNSGIFRLYAFDNSNFVSNRIYALQVQKDIRDYWLDYRGEFQTGEMASYTLNGLHIHWPGWSQSGGGSTLLDMTPGTPQQFSDATLIVGHTFSDDNAGVNLSVVDRSPVAGEWLDVAVRFRTTETNRDPSATISANTMNASIGEPIVFTITASDPDGDPLLFGWETSVAGYDEPLTVSSNSTSLTFAWTTPGQFDVRCRVSDMKGGIANTRILVNVGGSAGFSISGSVLSQSGAPLRDVRVFSLPVSVSTNDPSYVTHPDYRSAFTDDFGRYCLLNVPVGQQVVRALPTWFSTFMPSSGSGEPTIGPSVEGLDFVSVAKPSGTIRGIVSDGGMVVSNVVLQMAGLTAISQADGSFVFNGVPPGDYVLEATGQDQFINPNSPIYVDGADLNNVNVYRVLYPLKGSVPGGVGLIYVGTGEPGRNVLALPGTGGGAGAWQYQLNVPRGSWSLQATSVGLTLTPNNFSNPIAVAGLNLPYYAPQGIQPTAVSNLNFSSTFGTTYSIRGRITADGSPLVGVSVSNGSKTAITDSLGNYVIGGLSSAPYTVTASLSGYTFTNSDFSNPVSVGPDALNINFLAFATVSSPPNLVIAVQGNGTYLIQFDGVPGKTYRIEFNASLDPAAWEPLGSATVDPFGMFQFLDSPPIGTTSRFYRSIFP